MGIKVLIIENRIPYNNHGQQKLIISAEIDGEQHQRDSKQMLRDAEKDRLLIENEWKLLRIKWKDLFFEPKKYIQICKDFLD